MGNMAAVETVAKLWPPGLALPSHNTRVIFNWWGSQMWTKKQIMNIDSSRRISAWLHLNIYVLGFTSPGVSQAMTVEMFPVQTACPNWEGVRWRMMKHGISSSGEYNMKALRQSHGSSFIRPSSSLLTSLPSYSLGSSSEIPVRYWLVSCSFVPKSRPPYDYFFSPGDRVHLTRFTAQLINIFFPDITSFSFQSYFIQMSWSDTASFALPIFKGRSTKISLQHYQNSRSRDLSTVQSKNKCQFPHHSPTQVKDPSSLLFRNSRQPFKPKKHLPRPSYLSQIPLHTKMWHFFFIRSSCHHLDSYPTPRNSPGTRSTA